MTIDLTEIITAVLGLCFSFVTVYVVPWLKAKLGTAKLERLERYVQVAVKAAEQLYGSGEGAAKLAYVETYLEDHGLEVDRAVIEAKVRELFGKVAA